eukprot:Em0023g391a
MVEPLGRRGSCSFVHNEKFYLFHGYNGPHDRQREQGLYSYDLRTAEWSEDVLDTTRREKHVVSGEAFALVRSTLYTFGGWWDGERNSRVRELDLDTFRWREYTPNNPSEGPMHKDKAGMVAYGDEMLCVFGGYGEAPSVRNGIARQRGAQYDTDMASVWGFCWTNELHLFHLKNSVWISPMTTGPRPPPCAAFSFTKVDCHRVLLFGGRQVNARVNEIHILDMDNWSWSGAIIQTSPTDLWPIGRSFHAACSLLDPDNVGVGLSTQMQHRRHVWLPCAAPDLSPFQSMHAVEPKLFVLWGMDQNGDPISDAWELNINRMEWKELRLPPCLSVGHSWHTLACEYPSPAQIKAVVFGGTCSNMFSGPESELLSVNKTLVLEFGVSSLQQICLRYVVQEFNMDSLPASLSPVVLQGLRCVACQPLPVRL